MEVLATKASLYTCSVSKVASAKPREPASTATPFSSKLEALGNFSPAVVLII